MQGFQRDQVFAEAQAAFEEILRDKRPRQMRAMIILLILAILGAVPAILAIVHHEPSVPLKGLWASALLLAILLLGLIPALIGLPRLEITPQEIRYRALWNTQTAAWGSLAPFNVTMTVMRRITLATASARLIGDAVSENVRKRGKFSFVWTDNGKRDFADLLEQCRQQAAPASSADSVVAGQEPGFGRKTPLPPLPDEISRHDLEQFFGKNGEAYAAYYQGDVSSGVAVKKRGKWNWWVFFTGFVWFFYRKMYIAGSLLFLTPVMISIVLGPRGYMPLMFAVSRYANDFYVSRAEARIRKADMLKLAGIERDGYLQNAGGVSVIAGTLAGIVYGMIIILLILGAAHHQQQHAAHPPHAITHPD